MLEQTGLTWMITDFYGQDPYGAGASNQIVASATNSPNNAPVSPASVKLFWLGILLALVLLRVVIEINE